MLKILKLTLSRFKKCKLLSILAIVLMTASSMCLGSTFILRNNDKLEFLLRNAIDKNDGYAFLKYSSPTVETDSKDTLVTLDEKTLSKIDEYVTGNTVKCYKYSYEDTINFNGTKGPGYSQTASYLVNSVMELSEETGEEEAQIHRCERLSKETPCRLPNNNNEIAISALTAYSMCIYGAITKKYSYDTGSMEVFKPETIDELIGLNLYDGLTITGIYSSNDGMSEYFEPYITSGIDDTVENHIKKENLFIGVSPSCFAYVSKEFVDSRNYAAPTYVFTKLKGNYTSDLNFLKSFTTDKGEMLMPLSNYSGFYSYFSDAAINIKYHPELENNFWLHFWAYATPTIILGFISTVLYLYFVSRRDIQNEEGNVSNASQCLATLSQTFILSIISWAISLIGIQIILSVFNNAYGASMFTFGPAIMFIMLGASFLLTLLSAFSGFGISKLIPSKKKNEC